MSDMATPSALDTLIELATKDTDEAAKRLGRVIRASTDAEQKLALLMQYRDDYAARFQASMSRGVTATGYRNFQLLLGKLEEAINGQQRVVDDARKRVGDQRLAWQSSERKRISYDTLAARAIKERQLRETRRDQKQTDEFAARKLIYK